MAGRKTTGRIVRWGTVRRRRQSRRGSAIVEFALMLPILLTLALLCIDFGRFAHYYVAVTNAARAGAAFGSTHLYAVGHKAAWDAQVRQAVLDELSSDSSIDPAKAIVPTPLMTSEGNGLWSVQVDVTYPFQTLIPFDFNIVFHMTDAPDYKDAVPLHRRIVMRRTI